MSREKQDFRENLAMLNQRFPQKDMLRQIEVAEAYGVHRTTVYRWGLPFDQHGRISKVAVARLMST